MWSSPGDALPSGSDAHAQGGPPGDRHVQGVRHAGAVDGEVIPRGGVDPPAVVDERCDEYTREVLDELTDFAALRNDIRAEMLEYFNSRDFRLRVADAAESIAEAQKYMHEEHKQTIGCGPHASAGNIGGEDSPLSVVAPLI